MELYERPSIKQINPLLPSKGSFHQFNNPIIDIDGKSVEQLQMAYGSPLFIISEKQIKENIRIAKQAFATRYPKTCFAWSYKTNYANKVCQSFHEEGSLAEVVSRFELEKALRNGVPGHNIIFNGPNKSANDLEFALSKNVNIHIDNYDELFTLDEISKKTGKIANAAIRVNMKTGCTTEWERFGFNYESGEAFNAAKTIIETPFLKLVGIHCHIGTFILSTNPYTTATKKMSELALQIKKECGHTIEYIDMGGGFASKNTLKSIGSTAVPTIDDYAEAITTTLYNAPFTDKERPLLILETGRALIDDCAYLLSTIMSTKRSKEGKRLITIDAGVNILFTSFWYNHDIVPTRKYSEFSEIATIYGPLCMNIDVVRENILLPMVSKGDTLIIKNVGAYNMTQWMQFINLRPAIVFIPEKGQIELLKEKDSFNNIDY